MPAKVRNLQNGSVIIRDGANTPAELTVPIMEGDLAFTVTQPESIILNRGRLDSRKQADEVPVQVSFSFKFEQWSNNNQSTGISVPDVLQGVGGASSWVNADPNCGPWAVNLVFTCTDPCNTSTKETLTFNNFHATELKFSEGKDANTVNVTGTALVTKPTRTFA